MGHGWFVNKTRIIHMWDMPLSYLGHASFICGTQRMGCVHSNAQIVPVGHTPFVCGAWLIHTWDMTQSHVGHDSVTCGT